MAELERQPGVVEDNTNMTKILHHCPKTLLLLVSYVSKSDLVNLSTCVCSFTHAVAVPLWQPAGVHLAACMTRTPPK